MSLGKLLGSGRTAYRLKKLRMAAHVMHIGAHPDDEDVGLLSYLSHKFGVRTLYWSATRGEGGQNRIGSYSQEALGIYRSWETLSARHEDGGEAMFGPFFDYGYSKNADDTFLKWGREEMTRELVRAIRIFQPTILVARWLGEPSDLHGHHQAIGKVTYDAFAAAGDPNRYPELAAEGILPWKPLKLYHSTDNTGGDYSAGAALNLFGKLNPELERDGILRINTGEFDPIAGMTYQEQAWLAYNKHQTQAMGLAPTPGDFYYYFDLHKSLVATPSRENEFFDGLDPTLTGLATILENGNSRFRELLSSTVERVSQAEKALSDSRQEVAAANLSEGLGTLREAAEVVVGADNGDHRHPGVHRFLQQKIAEFENAICQCLGIYVEALAEKPRVTPGETFPVHCQLWNHRLVAVDDAALTLVTPDNWLVQETGRGAEGQKQHADFAVTVHSEAAFTTPYWLRTPRQGYRYAWPTESFAGLPFSSSDLQVQCQVALNGQKLVLRAPVIQRKAFPGGYRELPVMVLPPISLELKSNREFRPVTDAEQTLSVHVIAFNNQEAPLSGTLSIDLPDGWHASPASISASFQKLGDSKEGHFTVEIPGGLPEGTYTLCCTFNVSGRDYLHSIHPVRMGMPGVPGEPGAGTCIREENIITPAKVQVSLIAVDVAHNQTYAYVPGMKENIRDALASFGICFTELAGQNIAYADLSQFDVVVIGPNAYLLSEDVRKYAQKFLDYVDGGGTLIVQFQGYGFEGKGFTPYPFRYNQPHDRVTNENAEISVLHPDHLIFQYPNTIRPNDFNGWVHDRGMYFFREWDKHFKSLMSCADSGEDKRGGGFLIAARGRGTYMYTGYSFYRQLPAGIAGAFRLFVNILSLPAARLKERVDFLRKNELFQSFAEDQLESMARLMSERLVNDGHLICREGDEGNELFIIHTGEVDVLRGQDGTEKTIATVTSGTCVGEMSIIGEMPRTATLRARGDVSLLVIQGSHFLSLLNQNPEMALKLLKILVKRIAPSRIS